MEKYLKINEKMIIREEDKMVFSAKDMKIHKFNDKGYIIVDIISKNNKITKDALFDKVKDSYTNEEFNNIIGKMLANNIIVEYDE